MSEATRKSAMSLDDLIVLNDEIAAMVRAGVPLDQGLLATGHDMPGKLGALTTAVAVEIGRGATLREAIESDRTPLPAIYRAVVDAGLRSGRLAAALESVAGFLRRLAESRREITAALVYPVLVVIVAWCVGFFVFTHVMPMMHATLTNLTFGRSPLTRWLPAVSQAWYWAGVVPIALVLLAAWVWRCSGRATLMQDRASAALLGWMPWMGRMIRMTRVAAFTDVLALLVENEVPLEQGVVLAAESTGQPRLIESARSLAARLSMGEPPDAQRLRELAIPPMLGWMIASGLRHGALLAALRHAAKTYHRRAEHAAEVARIFLPVLFTLVIGGLAVLIAGLGLFLPYICMMHEMTKVW